MQHSFFNQSCQILSDLIYVHRLHSQVSSIAETQAGYLTFGASSRTMDISQSSILPSFILFSFFRASIPPVPGSTNAGNVNARLVHISVVQNNGTA